MNTDQRAQDYKSGFDQGILHSNPSPETKARMEAMKHEIEDFRREITTAFDGVGERLDEILEQTKKTNGRVNNLEAWKLKAEGGATVLKGVWGFMAVYLVGASWGLFNMYNQFQVLSYQVDQLVHEQRQ